MAHELFIVNGKASMMYVGEVPWHGLGKKLDKPATSEDAIRAAGLQWKVAKVPLYFGNKSSFEVVPDRFGVVREDLIGKPGCEVFGIVGKNYEPLQNLDAFKFFDDIVKGENAPMYHTAGALGGGERVWILAQLPDSIRVVGDDITDKFLLLSNSHDGQSSVQIKFTPIRVVCQNTLTMALSQGQTIKVAHTRDIQARLRNAEKLLGIVNTRYQGIEETFQRMVGMPLNKEKLGKYLGKVFPDPADSENEKAWQKVRRDRGWAEHFFEEGKGNDAKGVKGTLWAAYNGVAEYVDQVKRIGQTKDQKLKDIWFGNGYLVKARAYRVAQELMKAA